MNPLLDQLLVGLIVLGAVGWFAWRFLRRGAGGRNCGGGCCDTKKPLR
jgi:hypothetical protein